MENIRSVGMGDQRLIRFHTEMTSCALRPFCKSVDLWMAAEEFVHAALEWNRLGPLKANRKGVAGFSSRTFKTSGNRQPATGRSGFDQ